MRLAANPRYWRGRPAVSKIDLKIIPNSSTAMLQLRTGEVDLAYVTPSMVPQLPASIARDVAPSLGWAELAYNFSVPALADRRVRRAIALAIDRVKLARVTGHGLAKSDRAMLPLFAWALDPKVDAPPYDPASANRLLDEAGWKLDPHGVRRKGNASLEFTMVVRAGTDGVAEATTVSFLEAIHVHVQQKVVQPSVLFGTAQAGGTLASGKFDLAFLTLQTDPDPGISWLFACDQRSPAGYNFWRYCNPRLDAESNAAGNTFDRSSRMGALSSVQRRLMEDVAFVPLYRIDNMWAHADWLRGIVSSGYDPFWDVFAWTVSGA